MSLSSSAWFTGDDGPADPPSERPVPPVAAPEAHEAECHCDSFSDCYKDVTGRRPRDEIARWTCARVTQWFHENYIETSPRHFEPRVPFEGAPVSPRTLPVTPAERAAANMLRAWQAWPGTEMPIGEYTPYELFLLDVGDWLQELGLAEVETSEPTPAGAALLARVEGAPVPDPTAAIVAYIAAEEAKQRRDSKDPTHYDADTDRCITRAYILAAVGRRIERGDHLAPPIDAPPAKEPR